MHRVVLLTLALVLGVLGTRDATYAGAVFTVTVAADAPDNAIGDGGCDALPPAGDQCTLRAAIQEANFDIGPNFIFFDMSINGIYTIPVFSQLPATTERVTIDATTDPGWVESPVVVLDGSGAGPGVDGLRINGGDSVVKGLVIHSFSQNGIKIETNGLNAISGNYVGTNAAGNMDLGNGLNGIWIEDSDNNDIGGDEDDERNLVSGNQSNGIALSNDATMNRVAGNYVGTDATGTADLGNSFGGVVVVGANSNTVALNLVSGNNGDGISLSLGASANVVVGNLVGTDESGLVALGNDTGMEISSGASGNFIGTSEAGNVISGNDIANINVFDETSSGNMVYNNYIGPDIDGENELLPPTGPGNTGNGLQVFGAPDTVIGGPGVLGNVISGNPGTGIVISGASGTEIRNNLIGLEASGDTALPNGGQGIFVANASSNNAIGGPGNGEGNVISGNLDTGLFFNNDAVNNTVENNFIGTNEAGSAPIGNGIDGVAVFSSQNNVIGGSEAGEGNVISGNVRDGVRFFGATSTGNQVVGNLIGTEDDGESPLGNGNNGVYFVSGASDNTVGGVAEGEGNVIANNAGAGVIVDGAASTGNAVRGTSIHSNFELGIDNILGGNDELDPPVVTGFGSVLGTACPGCAVDVFSDDTDEGRVFEGTTTANGSGDWTLDVFPVGPNVTATATDGSGNTSEFSSAVDAPDPTPTPSPTATPIPTPTATPGPTATPTGTPSTSPGPTETPSGKTLLGDTDCDQDVDTVDGLFVLRDVAGFDPSNCIDEGDVDCDEDRDSVDALGILRHVAALPPLQQHEPCPDIGAAS